MDTIPLPVGSYALAAPAASCRRLVNCHVEQAPPDQPRGSPTMICRSPGVAAFVDTEDTEVRGFTKFNGILYAVAGSTLYGIASNGTIAECTGTAISGTGPVRMTNDGETIVVTPGNGHAYSSDGNTVAEILDADFVALGGNNVSQLDGYFCFTVPDSAEILTSGVNDITFDALDVISAEGAPGNLLGMIPNNRELIVVKEDSSEIFYDAANEPPGSPLARSPDGFKELGCAAALSLATQDNSPVMLASDKTFRRLGQVWQRFSNHGIEAVLQRLALLSDCIALPYTIEGHTFVAFNFPNAGRCLVFDFTSGEWHERESLVASASVGSWRVQAVIACYGKIFVGDRLSGKIGFLDPDTHTEWGEPQVATWTYQPVYSNALASSHDILELGITPGYGVASGQGIDPKLTLYISDDGGNTFRAKPVKSLGAMGAYRTKVSYENLGESTNRVYRCRLSDPVRFFALDTQLSGSGFRF